jgi:hypothetical protein
MTSEYILLDMEIKDIQIMSLLDESLRLRTKYSRCQFHQRFCALFSYEHRFGSFFYVHVTREKLPKRRLYKKIVRKMLMKLTTEQIFSREKESSIIIERIEMHFISEWKQIFAHFYNESVFKQFIICYGYILWMNFYTFWKLEML